MRLKNLLLSSIIVLGYSCHPIIGTSQTKAPLKLPKDIEALGKGYNIYGEYASPTSLKFQLFDFTKNIDDNNKLVEIDDKEYYLPSIIDLSNQRIKRETIISGSSTEEISKELAIETQIEVDYKVFSGSIEGKYRSKNSSSSNNYYMNLIDATVLRKYALNINFNNEIEIQSIKRYLRDDAKFRLNDTNYSNEDLFDLYGSHFLANAYIGAKAVTNTVTNNSDNKSEREISTAVETSVKRVTASLKVDQTNEEKTILNNTSTNFIAIGGKSSLMRSDGTGFSDWAESIESNSVLCDFDNRSLVPIWKLCDDSARAQQLENYFQTFYVKKKQYDFLHNLKKGRKVFKGSFSAPNKTEFIYMDNEGIKLVNINGTFSIGTYGAKLKNNGIEKTDWELGGGDEIIDVGDLDGNSKTEILIKNWWGIGVLSLNNENSSLKWEVKAKFESKMDYPFWNNNNFIIGNFNSTSKSTILSIGENGLYHIELNEKQLKNIKNYKINQNFAPNIQLKRESKLYKVNHSDTKKTDDIIIQDDKVIGFFTFKDGKELTYQSHKETNSSIGDIPLNSKYEFFNVYNVKNIQNPTIGAMNRNLIHVNIFGQDRYLRDYENKLVFFGLKENEFVPKFSVRYGTNLGNWNLRDDKILGIIENPITNESLLIIESDWGRGLLKITEKGGKIKLESIYQSPFK